MTYKPRTISIGAKGSEPTDGEIKGRPITVCDTSDVAVADIRGLIEADIMRVLAEQDAELEQRILYGKDAE